MKLYRNLARAPERASKYRSVRNHATRNSHILTPPSFPHRHSPRLPTQFGPVAGARARAHGRRIAVRPAGVKPALHVAVDRGVEHGRVVLKDVLRAIAVVDVPVHCACRCFVKGACV